jgi:tetratricopeptide (TPR) repeat protein
MFTSTLVIELNVHARAGDLTGVKQVKDRITLLAAKSPHWRAGQLLADAQFKRLCGELDGACQAFEACIGLSEPDASDPTRVVPLWTLAVGGFIETLVELDQAERAKAVGVRALELCRARSIEAQALEVARALGLAEAKLGEFDAAAARLHRVIEAQKQLGVSGLLLGATYEARARVAILAGDEAALGEFAGLTAREYRRSSGSPLGARHERLMDEARVAFPHRMVTLTESEAHGAASSGIERQPTAARLVSQVLRQATTARERASFALSLLCEDRRASAGFLYLAADQGLVLAAAQGDSEASPELHHSALCFLREQLADGELATQVESELQATLVRGRDRPTTADGLPMLIALGCPWQGSYQYVGVALLLSGSGQRTNAATQLAAAIATTLLEAGDARACTHADLASEPAGLQILRT